MISDERNPILTEEAQQTPEYGVHQESPSTGLERRHVTPLKKRCECGCGAWLDSRSRHTQEVCHRRLPNSGLASPAGQMLGRPWCPATWRKSLRRFCEMTRALYSLLIRLPRGTVTPPRPARLRR